MSTRVTAEAHPPTAIMLHWIHVVAVFALIFTGFYIHDPFFTTSMGFMRQTHFLAMFAFMATTVVRIYWAFAGAGSSGKGSSVKVRDWRHFGPERENRGQFLQTIRYYLFMRRTHPPSAKYNPLQKASYLAVPILVAAQALTGFSIWEPTAPTFAGLTAMAGGLAGMREIHYLIMWVFIVFLLVHVYLSVAEDIDELPAMFFGAGGSRSTSGIEEPAATAAPDRTAESA